MSPMSAAALSVPTAVPSAHGTAGTADAAVAGGLLAMGGGGNRRGGQHGAMGGSLRGVDGTGEPPHQSQQCHARTTGTNPVALSATGVRHSGVCLPQPRDAVPQRTGTGGVHRLRTATSAAPLRLCPSRRRRSASTAAGHHPAPRRQSTDGLGHRAFLHPSRHPQRWLSGRPLHPHCALPICLSRPCEGGLHWCAGCRRAFLRQPQHDGVRPLRLLPAAQPTGGCGAALLRYVPGADGTRTDYERCLLPRKDPVLARRQPRRSHHPLRRLALRGQLSARSCRVCPSFQPLACHGVRLLPSPRCHAQQRRHGAHHPHLELSPHHLGAGEEKQHRAMGRRRQHRLA